MHEYVISFGAVSAKARRSGFLACISQLARVLSTVSTTFVQCGYVLKQYIQPQLVTPPLTEMYWPVIHRAFSDTSKSTASAMSAGVPALRAARVISIVGC
jgi:hypothetical protein